MVQEIDILLDIIPEWGNCQSWVKIIEHLIMSLVRSEIIAEKEPSQIWQCIYTSFIRKTKHCQRHNGP